MNLEEGGISYGGGSGKFHQGLGWAVANTLKQSKNPDLYKLNYSSLWLALTGNAVWNAMAPSWQRYLYQLVLLSTKNLKILDVRPFVKSPEEVMKTKFSKKWQFENKAVFSNFEVEYMCKRVQNELTAYNNWRENLKKDWVDKIDTVLEEYRSLTKDLKRYNSQIAAIAQIRANAIFKSTRRGKKDTVPAGLTREARLEYLSFAAWIQATNPTGLGSDDRIETNLPYNDDEVAAEGFMENYLNIFREHSDTAKVLLEPWLKTAEMKAMAIIKASKV
jgi:hypothetical protein